MNLIKLNLLRWNDPFKLGAIFAFALMFFLFIGEIMSLLSSSIPMQTVPTSPIIEAKLSHLNPNSPLFKKSLFGIYVPNNLTDQSIQQSSLDMEVMGILFAKQEEDSQVIIRIGEQGQATYRVGDKLTGNVIIKRISKTGIVVLHNGSLERLSLPNNELKFAPPTPALIH